MAVMVDDFYRILSNEAILTKAATTVVKKGKKP